MNQPTNWIVYGCGGFAKLVRILRRRVNERGDDIVTYRVLPTQELIDKYSIPPGAFKEDDTIEREYLASHQVILDDDPAHKTIFMLCDFNGDETIMVNMYSHLLEQVEYLKRDKSRLKGQVAVLNEKLTKIHLQERTHDKELVEKMKTLKGAFTYPIAVPDGRFEVKKFKSPMEGGSNEY